ncbi:adenosylcobinamide-GDP ribazoletransferase [cyanobiont of Ornithocercus magnificus]|nr:adenosylcobinamide-GDP ribazoletransferase [cyanobiont of Ornithocercus magnificus]
MKILRWLLRSSLLVRRHVPEWLQDLAGAWTFYSILPIWPQLEPSFKRIARFAPWIGLVTGSIQAGLWLGLSSLSWSSVSTASAVLGLGLWITGGLHHDGLMDTADGLAARADRRLAAMEDSRVGASGVQAFALLLLLQLASLIHLGPLAPPALVLAAVWGRIAPFVALQRFPYLRLQEGSAGFHQHYWQGWRELLPLLPLSFVLSAMLCLPHWHLSLPSRLIGLAAGLVPALIVPERLGRQLGGHSGDSYGATVVATETVTLLLLALLWSLAR